MRHKFILNFKKKGTCKGDGLVCRGYTSRREGAL